MSDRTGLSQRRPQPQRAAGTAQGVCCRPIVRSSGLSWPTRSRSAGLQRPRGRKDLTFDRSGPKDEVTIARRAASLHTL